ncbi:MAG TPA: hypothetical protein VD793_09785, partial [Gemmatimonadales bacterium]|nr:hypothetical protein [Gemmatimonadales bacterium]
QYQGMNILIDVLGWFGAGAVLAAYWMVSTHRVTGSARRYQGLNAFGSVFLLLNTLYYGAYPSTFVNGIWLGIAVWALGRRGAEQ